MNRKILIVMVLLALSALASAQQVTETTQRPQNKPITPPAVLKFDVSFDGDNAGKIQRFILYVTKLGPIPADQPGFLNQFDGGQVQVSSAVSHSDVKIGDNAATGEYRVSVTAWTADNTRIEYSPEKVGLPPISVDNPAKFIPPGITVVERP